MGEELRELGAELSGLRREVLEMRNLVIRTDNLLKNFGLELKDIAKRQAQSEQKHFVGHIAAYVVIAFIAVSGALMYGAAVARSSRQEATALLEEAKQKRDAASAAELAARQATEARDRANAEAMSVWELITSADASKQQEGLERAAKLEPAKLSTFARAVLEQTGGTMRRSRAEEAYQAGMADYKKGNIRGAKTGLERFLQLAQYLPADWKKPERLQASLYLGAACNQLGEHPLAIPHLKLYVAQGDSSSLKAYAYLLLGDSLEATKQSAEAQKAYRAGLQLGPSGFTESTLQKRVAGQTGDT
jgi:tetratricopeptide (TPR) repeat protein